MNAIIPSEVDNFGVYQASCCRNTRAWFIASHQRLHPSECFCVQIENVVQLSQLIWLSSENVNFFIKSYCRMLKSSSGRCTLCLYWTGPFKTIKIQNEQIIEPEFSVSTSKDKHLIVYDTRGMKLSHWCLTSDNTWNIEAEFFYSFLQVNKYDIGKNLKSIPPSVYDNLTAVPYLT
jgi:hypothetical protein